MTTRTITIKCRACKQSHITETDPDSPINAIGMGCNYCFRCIDSAEEKQFAKTYSNYTFSMKKIVIKTCEKSKWLRLEAINAIEEFEAGGAEKKEGILHREFTPIKSRFRQEYQIYVYQTKTCIICNVRQTKEA